MTRRQPDDKQAVSENVIILATVDVILKTRKSTACGCPAPEIVRRQVRAKILFQKNPRSNLLNSFHSFAKNAKSDSEKL